MLHIAMYVRGRYLKNLSWLIMAEEAAISMQAVGDSLLFVSVAGRLCNVVKPLATLYRPGNAGFE